MKIPRFLRAHPLLSRLALFVLMPAFGVCLYFWVTLKQAVPADGVSWLRQGVSAPVMMRRDEHGVAHIQASNDQDAFFAVGYAQAQDRLWQLEMERRMVRGTLSEVLGRDSVDADVWFRTLGLVDSARSAWPALSPQARQSLTSYTAGINAAIAQMRTLPLEFTVLDTKPEPWTELDSLAWIKMFALNLSGNFHHEIDRYLSKGQLSKQQFATFFPDASDSPETGEAAATASHGDAAALMGLADAQEQLRKRLHFGAPGTGSNAWVVGGRFTADGGSILANDPHLSLQIPSLWYAVSIDAPTLKVAGMSLVGLPLVIFGHNDRISWGGTNMMADTQDLFIERADASGGNYLYDGAWRPFDSHVETIQVRSDFPSRWRRAYAPVRLQVRTSAHGRIISDAFKVFDAPVALRWTALDPGDTSYEAFYRLGYAGDWNQFTQALRFQVAPAMNMLYGDRAGHIGYLGAGRIPVRRTGEGSQPNPGWDGSHDWTGVVPPEQWPQVYDPPQGYLVSANQRPVGAAYPFFISNDWASPARARRIEQLLKVQIDAGHRFKPEDMGKIQADTQDENAQAMMRYLIAHLPTGEHADVAARLLRNWNGDMRGDSQAATIFTAWMRHLRKELFSEQLHGTWNSAQAAGMLQRMGDGVPLDRLATILEHGGEGWCGQGGPSAQTPCAAQLATSLDDALDELHTLKGDWSMQSWHWDQLQHTVYRHTPFSRIKPFDLIFERRVDNGGSANSIDVAGYEFAHADGYLQTFGAGFRQVMNLGPQKIDHLYMNSTGQSGNLMSSHYDDMVQEFQEVRYFSLDGIGSGSSEKVGGVTVKTESPR